MAHLHVFWLVSATEANQPIKEHNILASDQLITIIIATYNEAEVIEGTLNSLLESLPQPFEIIVVDDSPNNETSERINALDNVHIKLIKRPKARGLASAIMRGIIESQGQIIGWIDADAWMMPDLLPKMIEDLAGHHMVIASRYVPGGDDQRSKVRTISSKIINEFAGIVLGRDIKDYTSNFTVMKREVFDHVIPMPYGFGESFIELVYRANLHGLSILEVPYVLSAHDDGDSKAFPNWFRFFQLGSMYVIRIIIIRIHAITERR